MKGTPLASWRKRQCDLRRHPRFENALRVGHVDFDREDLMMAFLRALYVPWRELALGCNVRNLSLEALLRISIHGHFRSLVQAHLSELGLRDVGFYPEIIGSENTQNRLVGLH